MRYSSVIVLVTLIVFGCGTAVISENNLSSEYKESVQSSGENHLDSSEESSDESLTSVTPEESSEISSENGSSIKNNVSSSSDDILESSSSNVPSSDVSSISSEQLPASSSSTMQTPTEYGVINPDNGAFKYFGRFDFSDPLSPEFDWPGAYIKTRFFGRSLTVLLSGTGVYFDIFIDDEKVPAVFNESLLGDATLQLKSGKGEYVIANDLSNELHTLKIAKRSETNWASVRFNGLILGDTDGAIPPLKTTGPRIEIIGDSYSVGYGNLSPSKTNSLIQDASGRECTSDEITAFTDTHQAYGPIAAMELEGEYFVHAYSGIGMERNYGGSTVTGSLPSFYPLTIHSNPSSADWDFSTWQPDVVVILLGTNDFSTPLAVGEEYSTREELQEAYATSYRKFITNIRLQYPGVSIICAAPNIDEVSTLVQEIITQEEASGASNISYFYYNNVSAFGCHWHPDRATHVEHGLLLASHIDSLLSLQ